MDNLDLIDKYKVFLPIETQRLSSAAPMKIDSAIVVDWKDLKHATSQAWVWLGLELLYAARSEGYQMFWERQRRQVHSISHSLSQLD